MNILLDSLFNFQQLVFKTVISSIWITIVLLWLLYPVQRFRNYEILFTVLKHIVAGFGAFSFLLYIFSFLQFGDSYYLNRAFGPYWWAYWFMFFFGTVVPMLLWVRVFGSKKWILTIVAVGMNLGMFFERLVILITSLHRDFLPASWGMIYPWSNELYIILNGFILAGLLLLGLIVYERTGQIE